MWIRSQSKKVLLNVNQVVINNNKDKSEYYIYGYSERGIDILGVYSTQDKALKVLDEIQRFISDKQYCAIDNVTRKSYILNKGVHVFEMPKDEDVEVWQKKI